MPPWKLANNFVATELKRGPSSDLVPFLSHKHVYAAVPRSRRLKQISDKHSPPNHMGTMHESSLALSLPLSLSTYKLYTYIKMCMYIHVQAHNAK